MQVFDTPEGIAFYQLAARKSALSLELKGLKRRGRSAYSICKSEYGLKGSRESVLAQMQALVDAAIAQRQTCANCGHSRGSHYVAYGDVLNACWDCDCALLK